MGKRISLKWRKVQPIYEYFARLVGVSGFSEESALEMYLHESTGSEIDSENPYRKGKQMVNVHLQTWREDIKKGLLFKWELYNSYPESFHWFLCESLKGVFNECYAPEDFVDYELNRVGCCG